MTSATARTWQEFVITVLVFLDAIVTYLGVLIPYRERHEYARVIRMFFESTPIRMCEVTSPETTASSNVILNVLWGLLGLLIYVGVHISIMFLNLSKSPASLNCCVLIHVLVSVPTVLIMIMYSSSVIQPTDLFQLQEIIPEQFQYKDRFYYACPVQGCDRVAYIQQTTDRCPTLERIIDTTSKMSYASKHNGTWFPGKEVRGMVEITQSYEPDASEMVPYTIYVSALMVVLVILMIWNNNYYHHQITTPSSPRAGPPPEKFEVEMVPPPPAHPVAKVVDL